MAAEEPARLASTVRARNPISRRQVETVVSRSVAVFGLVYAAQTVRNLLPQLGDAQPWWLWTVVPALVASLTLATVCSFARRFVRPAHAIVSIVYFLALASWPFTILPEADVGSDIHWLYYLLTVATSCAAIAFSTLVASVYLLVVPWFFFLGRIMPNGGGAPIPTAALETVYSIFLGGALLILLTLIRQASSNVDSEQTAALDRYAHAVRQHALEVERVQVDAIVHDSVLTTLLSAARAQTAEAKALAATMAGNAMGHLRDATLVASDDGSVRVSAVAARIRDAVDQLAAPFDVETQGLGSGSMPVAAAEAVFSATVQAAVNSVNHAGAGVARTIAVRGVDEGIAVEIVDEGAGFDPALVPQERLGVRRSIVERVANAGGRAEVRSAPGEGTTVAIRWPHQEGVQAPAFADIAPELVGDDSEVAR